MSRREGWFTPYYLSECQSQTAGFPAVHSQPYSSEPNMEKRSSKAATMVHGTHHLPPYHHRHPTTCSHTFPILCSLHILLRNRNSVPGDFHCSVQVFLKVDGKLIPLWKDNSLCENNGHGGASDGCAQNCTAAILALEYEDRKVRNSRLFPTIQQSLRPICAT